MAAQNPTITQLDVIQAIRRTYDEANDALRVEVAGGVSFAVSLDHTDSVVVLGTEDGTAGGTYHALKTTTTGSPLITPNGSSTKVSLTSASTGTVIGPVSCAGMKSFNLYTNTTSTITGAQALTLLISPSDTDNVWIAATLTVTESTTNAVVVKGTTETDVVARRVRVDIAAAISTGTFDAYLVMAAI